AMNRDTSHTDALGCTTTHLYDGNGNNVEVEGPNGVRSKFTFDKMNRQTGAEHDSSKSSAEYSKAGDPRKRTDPNGNVTTFVFDANHRLIEEIDPYGFKITYEYDSTGNVVKITDKKGNVTCMVYDARDDEIARINAMGDSTISIRDAAGQVVATINERGFTTSFVLDALGRNTQTIFPIGQQTREYDAASNVVAEIDAEGLRTRHEYDSLHRLVRTIFADSTAVAYAYDAENNPTTFTNEENETTVTSYDARNQRASVANALGETTLFEYNCLGQLVGTVLPNGNVVRSVFDQQGRLVAQHDGMGQIFIHAFDDAGNQTEVTDANGNRMRYKPDALHRTVEITDAEGNSSAVVYDPNSNPVQTADRNGHPTFFTYDSLDRRTGLTNALGHHIRYAFDAAGNLVGITDAKGNSTTYVYDGNNRQTDEIFADGTSKKTEYNLANVAVAFTDNMGRRTQLYHDRRYRLIRRDLPDANDDHFTYSPSGRMLTAVNADATVAFAYDPAGRLVGETLNGRTTAYEYDIPAWRRKITYPSGLVVVETADLRGRMGHISAGGAEVARWTHDSGNRILARQYANGVVSRHTHDRNNRTTSLQHANTAGVLVGFNYAFDLEDNKRYEAKIHRPELSERYGYDRIYRLDTFLRGNLTAQSFTFEELFQYDALGNREQARQNGVPTTYTANEMNEYTSISGQPAPTHDGNGNQTFDGVHTYQFDFKNMVISVDGGATARYRYDALGRRICKITAADTAYFYFAGWREIEALKGSGALGRQWVYGIYIDEMVAMLRPGLPPLFYLQNSLYSVHALADANGNLAEGYLYDAYGKVTVFGAGANGRVDFGGDDAVGSASFLGNPCLFTGRWLDGETGGYYYRMRRMDAREGRFLQRDPIGYFDELNTYTYVGNNTTNSIDPLGLFDIIEMIKKFIRTALIIGISSTSQNSEVGGLLRDMGEMFSQESPVEVEEPPNRRPRPVNPRPVNPRPPSRPPTSIPPRGPKPPTSNPLKAGGAV
ncbi:MAG: RHS repeat protein, partial [Saprospiraceae bacterium]|nr:RHS repeat protein [Saprospiraceae bacterium]